ncbi:hypothetical protein [Yersinia pestis]|uniref:hypothetical protein n=1 Tax=Yersinia pestis TaxID=632 RepID=UPI0006968655|nr:hypothetical protein [Yersinia pestis]OVY70671.1 hypothetical protein BFI50_20135 [Yersinia pestis subsp. microtus bv. Xilingolensis]OVY77703.1 hypothetical protein BFI51_19805 [Yersinia pestis subsp. microtus bv. Xilingolensis]
MSKTGNYTILFTVSLTQATRCYEGFLSGTQFPTVRLLSPFDILWLFSALMARNTPLAILFSSKPIPGFGVYCYAHFSLAIIGCKGSQNLIRM